MSLLPQNYLKTIVGIGIATKQEPFSALGTGFLVKLDLGFNDNKGEKIYHGFLVTNKHVLSGQKEIILRFNNLNSSYIAVPIKLEGTHGSHWLDHPEKEIDISVVNINLNALIDREIDFACFNRDDFLVKEDLIRLGVTNGDEIFVLGFPMGIVGTGKNYPIVRSGIIARIDEETLNIEKQFYIDCSIYGGNSGGPVILKPSMISIEGTDPINKAYVLGIVKSVRLHEETLYSFRGDGLPIPRMILYEHSNLGFAVIMDFVIEAASQLASTQTLQPIDPSKLNAEQIASNESEIEVKNHKSL